MSPQSFPRQTPKKISTMPRKETPANVALENYKLTMEEARLQQELKNIECRRKQILQRLDQLTQQIDHIQAKIMGQPTSPNTQVTTTINFDALPEVNKNQPLKPSIKPEKLAHSFQFKTMDIDY